MVHFRRSSRLRGARKRIKIKGVNGVSKFKGGPKDISLREGIEI